MHGAAEWLFLCLGGGINPLQGKALKKSGEKYRVPYGEFVECLQSPVSQVGKRATGLKPCLPNEGSEWKWNTQQREANGNEELQCADT